MKTLAPVGGAALLVVTFAFVAAAQTQGWTPVFDGKTLNAFDPIGDANWRVADGAIQADGGKGGFLMSKQSFGDFEIRAEFWVDEKANSGIFLRCANPKAAGADTCYEVNVFDTRPDPSYGTGGIVDVVKVTTPIKTGGKWNTYEIRAQGSHLVVTLNGTKTVDVQDTKHARGPFALQWGAGVVKFRSVQIRPL